MPPTKDAPLRSGLRRYDHARLVLLPEAGGFGLVEDGALLVEDGRFTYCGPAAELPPEARAAPAIDLHGALVTPGLIDCHTHLVYGGDRAREWERRLTGVSYEQIAKEGGGIRSTVTATRAASEDELFEAAEGRARTLLREGVTTLEIKSGYGLSAEHEARMLRVARRIGQALPLEVVTTYLGAHTVPPEFEGRADAYVDAVCDWLPALHAEGLVDAVDAFCETIGFTPAQTRRVFEAARALGIPVKLHAEQLSDQKGAVLAAEYGALSCDHLEHLGEDGVEALRRAGSVAVLLPGAYYFLRETKLPPIDALRTAGVPMALATDHNPGSSPATSLHLMLSFACTFFRLTPEEALRGVTVHGARALGLADRGRLAAGLRADFVAFDLHDPAELAYWFGTAPDRRVFVAGEEWDPRA